MTCQGKIFSAHALLEGMKTTKDEVTQTGVLAAFLEWANGSASNTDPVLKAAIAPSVVRDHSFDDRNSRIPRAIADWALARSDHSPQRFYSMSAQICHERSDYYDVLEKTQKGTLDITVWLFWFLGCLNRAFDGTEVTLRAVLRKALFSDIHAKAIVNERQRDIVNRLLDRFDGKLTTTKWAKIEKCSHDTALCDIQDLIEQGLIKKDRGGGRSTRYSLTRRVICRGSPD